MNFSKALSVFKVSRSGAMMWRVLISGIQEIVALLLLGDVLRVPKVPDF